MSWGGSETFLLVYYPKAEIGDPFAEAEETHDDGVQLSLVGSLGQARFVLRHDGKPVADAAVRLVLPDGSEEELLTDAEGATPAVAARGRLAAWVRHFEATLGEHLGEAYGEIRHYPSLVVDVPAEGEATAASGEASLTKTRMLLPLPGAAWQVLPQPFIRRALIAAVVDGKLFVLGGFTDRDEVSQRVDVFDPATGQWSTDPDLPGGGFNGFAPAACTIEGSVFISAADGSIHRLAAGNVAWEPVAKVSPRIVHRMVRLGNDAVVLLGGAHRRDNLDVVEVVPLP